MSDAEVDERPNKRLKRGENPEDDDDSDEDDDGEEEVIGKDGKKVKSKGGSSCHQCKSRRNFTALTYCTSNLDKKNKRCRKKFCGHCLKKFYKESTQAIADKGNWKCPSCRKICCCAACRRRKTKEIGKEESSPAHTSKPKKAASHKSTHQRERNTHANHHDGNDAPYHSSSREDEGYPPQHRRGDRSLLHSSHSPRLNGRNSGGLMTDSPVQHGMSNYDMMDDQRHHDGDEYSSDNQHSYSESDHDSDDTDGSDDEAALNAHASGSQHYLHDDDPSTSLPSSQFTTLLSTHIKSLAEESARSPNTPFARLYKQAQQTKIKKKIKAILLRPDIKKEKKVELIAALLAPLEEQSTHEMPTSQQQQQQQQQQQPHVSMQTGI